jgi:Fic-DOC domain mobile mystery protein B
MARNVNFITDGCKSAEGATPIRDYSGLKLQRVHDTTDLNRVEAENIMKAQLKFLQNLPANPQNWVTIKELRNIHRAMFGDVWEWAGEYRKSETSIGIQPGLIPSQLAEFCFEVQSWSQYCVERTFLEMAARIHHRLVEIHPFENGNGRFSRLIADRFLLAWRFPHPMWPGRLGDKSAERSRYIQALKSADQGDYTSLISIMKRFGARDPTIVELLESNFYKKHFNRDRLRAMVSALLREGADPNKESPKGHQPLLLAVKMGAAEIVELLLDAGADINAAAQGKLTPFQMAVQQQNKTIADLLVSRGAKRQAPPGTGYAAYYNLYREMPPI